MHYFNVILLCDVILAFGPKVTRRVTFYYIVSANSGELSFDNETASTAAELEFGEYIHIDIIKDRMTLVRSMNARALKHTRKMHMHAYLIIYANH